jgi:hypothetical protein
MVLVIVVHTIGMWIIYRSAMTLQTTMQHQSRNANPCAIGHSQTDDNVLSFFTSDSTQRGQRAQMEGSAFWMTSLTVMA